MPASKRTPLQALTEKYREVFHNGHSLDMELLFGLSQERTLYCFLIMPRSGSTWLSEIMMRADELGTPNEWLNPQFIMEENVSRLGCAPPKFRGTADINEYFTNIARESTGAAGIQLSYW